MLGFFSWKVDCIKIATCICEMRDLCRSEMTCKGGPVSNFDVSIAIVSLGGEISSVAKANHARRILLL
mgnify:CR=1 FL=1